MKTVADSWSDGSAFIDRIFLGSLPKSVSAAIAPILIVLAIIASMLFQGSEAGGETWGYWHFAQIITHKFEFVHPDRSPLACLYLVPFTMLPYPLNIDLEYFSTSLILCLSLYGFLRSFGVLFSVVTTILIFLRVAAFEPFTQHLALAAILIAISYRIKEKKGQSYSPFIFYSFLAIAYLMRGTFIFTFVFFVGYDLIRIVRNKMVGKPWDFSRIFIGNLGWKQLGLPIFLLGFIIVSSARQSSHPWNNTWLVDVDWIPAGETSLLNVGMIGHFNWVVGDREPDGKKDIYFTHQKYFDGEKNFAKIIMAHQSFYYDFLRNNLDRMKQAFNRLIGPNWVSVVRGVDLSALILSLSFYLVCILSLMSLSRAFEPETTIMSTSLILSSFIVLFIFPKARYVSHHLIVLVLGIVSISHIIQTASIPRFAKSYGLAAVPFLIYAFVFSSNAYDLNNMLHGLRASMKYGFHLRQANSGSMKIHYAEFREELKGCHAVMSLEHNFFASFFYDRGLQSYSVLEVPPFGRYGYSSYAGLNPERVDCLVISNDLAQGEGVGTTIRTRYRDFIVPFEADMVSRGGRVAQIPGWGRIVSLKKT